MTVCNLCRYNPPSSADGKPCTMCPASTNEEVKVIPIEVLREIRVEIEHIETSRQIDEHTAYIRTAEQSKKVALDVIDKHLKDFNA